MEENRVGSILATAMEAAELRAWECLSNCDFPGFLHHYDRWINFNNVFPKSLRTWNPFLELVTLGVKKKDEIVNRIAKAREAEIIEEQELRNLV